MPASTRRLRAIEHRLQIAVRPDRQSLDAIEVFRRHLDGSTAITEGRAIARLPYLRRRAAVVAIRVREELHGVSEPVFQHSLRPLELECALRRRELREGAMRGAV